MTAPFEHATDVRDALRAIMADPALGPEPLADVPSAANLLRDLLPDAPRETSLLLAAIAGGSPTMLREYVAQGMAGDMAISLTAAALASRTAFTPGACQWVVTELAIALSLVPAAPAAPAAPAVPAVPAAPAAQIAPHPPTEVRAEASAAPEPAIAPVQPVRTTLPGSFRPEPVRSHRGSGRRKFALLTATGLALAAAVGVGLYAVRPGTAAHHRGAPGRHHGGTPTAPANVRTPPDNAWIAQLASVSLNAGNAALDSVLARVRRDVPRAQVLNTDAYASLRPGYWMIYYVGPFATGTQALAYCAAHRLASRGLCIGRFLSKNRADFRYQCYPPAASPSGICVHPRVLSPADAVEAYIAAVNQHNWARAWVLGGKNLGETYSQMIAGYSHTRHVQITSITSNGPAVTVTTTATETNGTIQRYRLSYLVSNGIITAGQSTLING